MVNAGAAEGGVLGMMNDRFRTQNQGPPWDNWFQKCWTEELVSTLSLRMVDECWVISWESFPKKDQGQVDESMRMGIVLGGLEFRILELKTVHC